MISAFEHPWVGGLFGDPEGAALWSSEAQLGHYLAFEIALAHALETADLVAPGHGADAAKAMSAAEIDLTSLRKGTARDGLPIPVLVRLLREAAGASADAIHTGATSQDVLDTALSLTLRDLIPLLIRRLETLDRTLQAIEANHCANALMGRTRMQAALPITAGDRVRAWRAPLPVHAARLRDLSPRVTRLQLGGAVGTRSGFGSQADQITTDMATELGLEMPSHVWHSDRSQIAELGSALSALTGSLGKMGQDVALMTQQGLDEIQLEGGGGSSAMPHKSNPVLAELLITLARFNATQLPAVHHALIHEQERSGAAWMLEWMVLPQMATATCRALSAAQSLCEQIVRIGNLEEKP